MKKLISFIMLFGACTMAFAQYLVTDPFSGAGPVGLGGNWTTASSGTRISGVVQKNAGTIVFTGGGGFDPLAASSYTGLTFGNDQYAQFVAGPDSVFNSNSSPMIRMQGTTGAGYAWDWDTSSIRIWASGGTSTDVTMTVACPNEGGVTTGHVARIAAIGSTIFCFDLTSGQFGYGTDSTYTSGSPGVMLGSFSGHTTMSGPFQADCFPYSCNSVEATPYSPLYPRPNIIDYYSAGGVTVTLTPQAASWVQCYTTDGTTPTATTPGTCSHGTTYSTPFSISATGLTTVKTIATKVGQTNSAENDYTYNIGAGQVPVLNGVQIFPSNSIFNTRIDALPVQTTYNTAWHAVSGVDAAHIFHDFYNGAVGGSSGGIPMNTAVSSDPTYTIPSGSWFTPDESDDGPYSIPSSSVIENRPGTGCQVTSNLDQNTDYHMLTVVNLGSGAGQLQEIYQASCVSGSPNVWSGNSGAIWDLTSNNLRPDTWTSSDAAGLPVLPFLVKYDEAASGIINHPLRFTLNATGDVYLWPARHQAGKGGALPTGARIRLKSSFDISGYSPINQAILTAMKNYGMFEADNGNTGYFQGVSDPRWNEADLDLLNVIAFVNFEVVDESACQISADSGQSSCGAASVSTTVYGAAHFFGLGSKVY